MSTEAATAEPTIERQSMDVDIACVGFGPAMGGFLTGLSRGVLNEDGTPAVESRVMPGMIPQVICYERADDIAFGVSGVVTRARAIKASFPGLDPGEIPMAHPVTGEQLLYLLDPVGASRRSATVRAADAFIRGFKWMLPVGDHALRIPFIPGFMQKHGGLLFSIGQFNQWVGNQLMATGAVQVWPSSPVAEPLMEEGRVTGIRLADQGVERTGEPQPGFMPGMDIKAALTVIGDGPVGPVGRKLDEQLGLPDGHHQRDWAVGMKVVVELPEGCELKPGTVIHTLGYPEPEIFGFLYVYPDGLASGGIFVPSWFDNPVRATYRYLQHWMQHPALWKHLNGGTLRSWGAKTLQESGRRGEPHLVGDGFARIGEGSGSTNVLTGSGMDEAWLTGTLLAEGVLEILKSGGEFTRESLEKAYVRRRRESWLEREARQAEKARDGFQRGFVRGMIGMALAGFTKGRLSMSGDGRTPYERVPSLEKYVKGRLSAGEVEELRAGAHAKGETLHDIVMEAMGWPRIAYDGKLLLSQQDALLVGGKVQAPPGYADHVVFVHPELCGKCGTQICAEMCSAEAISVNPGGGVPLFDREKCIHCGACLWNCSEQDPDNGERGAVAFRAGAGGLHSAEN